MKDEEKTKEQLLKELTQLRRHVERLEWLRHSADATDEEFGESIVASSKRSPEQEIGDLPTRVEGPRVEPGFGVPEASRWAHRAELH